MLAFTYILECSDGTYYTGYTKDFKRRLVQHQNGVAAKYTRGRRPVRIVYLEEYDSVSGALKREKEIQNLTRNKKEQLIISSSNILSTDI